jgi:hypothetical protein
MRKLVDNMGCGLAGKMGFLARWVVVLITVLISASTAVATPTMTVDCEHYLNDYSPAHVGDELQVIYTVTNTSEPGNSNKMLDFTLPAGSNQGVYDAVSGNGWAFEIDADSTRFYQGSSPALQSGEQMVLELYSTILTVSQDWAAATARGVEIPTQFPPVLVDVPGDLHTLAGDISGDGIVDANDVGMMAENWLAEGAGNVADISAGGLVDFVDFAMLANDWGKQEPWYVP